jgi:RHS repeat-associated protein
MAQRCFSADWSRPLARWGETLIEEKATRPGMHFESPYRFNAKELDEESGLYYYGARYYNPMVSVWLGVDPLAGKFYTLTPYHFVANNPIMIIDPDGRDTAFADDKARQLYLNTRNNVTDRISSTMEDLSKEKVGSRQYKKLDRQLENLNKLLNDFKKIESKDSPKATYSTNTESLEDREGGKVFGAKSSLTVFVRPDRSDALIHENRHVNQIFNTEGKFEYTLAHEIEAYQYQGIYDSNLIENLRVNACSHVNQGAFNFKEKNPLQWKRALEKFTLEDMVRFLYPELK